LQRLLIGQAVAMKQDVRASASNGVVSTSAHDGVIVHTYLSPEDGLLVNTQIVEGPTRLVMFDGQYFLPHAREVAAYAESLAKPVDRIVLSHIHLDHWGGLSAIIEHFPDAPVYAVPGVANYLRRNGQKVLDRRKPALGDNIPDRPTIPTRVLPEGRETIDGITFEFKRFVNAESAIQLVALMSEQQTLLAFDLALRRPSMCSPSRHTSTTGSGYCKR
jgi:glyoxylase-like metal-dependent hydrolase (beta-lactamase superfamily II)